MIEEVSFVLFEFCFETEMLIYCEDNLLKVWNGKAERQCTIKLSIPTGHPLALSSCNGITAVASTSGAVHIFGINFNLIKSLEIWRLLGSFYKNIAEGTPQDFSSHSFPVFDVHLFSMKFEENESKYFPPVTYMLAITSTCALIVNINNEDVKFVYNFTVQCSVCSEVVCLH
ncbi:uncharacterized protein LOC129220754 [Uloborus diversus]|uniref:uncharacterized protein LOC129220754 n=1 Tax=Uloborus diversus TaxID=327109 RepID=UPI00240A215B|nr:uncharacterized protein LOC129220754 [Uloborus diversus]